MCVCGGEINDLGKGEQVYRKGLGVQGSSEMMWDVSLYVVMVLLSLFNKEADLAHS